MLRDKKILIIEDTGKQDSGCESLLQDSGSRLYFSLDVEDGVEIAERYSPDVIITAIDRAAEAESVISKIAASKTAASIPLITILPNGSIALAQKAILAGADAFLFRPVEREPLIELISARLKKAETQKRNLTEQINSSLEASEFDDQKNHDHILVKIGIKLKLLKFSKICFIESQKEYSKIVTADKHSIIVRKSLRLWEEILPAEQFLRIHRSYIINISYIDRIEKASERTYAVYLREIDDPLVTSYRYANIMRNVFHR